MTQFPRIVLRKKRAASLERRHPWVFSGAVERVEGASADSLEPGATVDVVAADGRWLARGAYSPQSQIAVRVWTFDEEEAVDAAFFRRRLEAAVEIRREFFGDPLSGEPETNDEDQDEEPLRTAYRLVHGESDGLPGLLVDRYADVLVVQVLAVGAERWREVIVDALAEIVPAVTIYERSDVEVREKEGLELRSGTLRGPEPPARVEIDETGFRFLVDVREGHKTGFYLDQRDSRVAVAAAAEGRRVLNVFSYTGAFTVAALLGGAESVVQIDASAAALSLADEMLDANELPRDAVESVEGNAFGELRRLRAEGRTFDMVLLDPPKFVESKSQLERAARGYKDINLLACQLLAPGGLLFTWSCSGLLAPDLFQKIVADAALDAGRFARVLLRLGASADHPTALSFPEGSYLKGLLLRVD